MENIDNNPPENPNPPLVVKANHANTTSTTSSSSSGNSTPSRSYESRDPRSRRPKPEEPYRINELIRVTEVRLVGENVEAGVYPIKKAIAMAKEQNLDLVEISAKADPPVCRITDYSKFKYEQKKKQKELKVKTHKTVVKEIRFSPDTGEHDFQFKVKHAENFLKEGNKVKTYVTFMGRSIVFSERGQVLLLRFAQALEEVAKVDQLPKMEGKRMIMFLSPKATK